MNVTESFFRKFEINFDILSKTCSFNTKSKVNYILISLRNKNWEQNYWQVKCFIIKNISGLIWSTHINLPTLKVRFFHHNVCSTKKYTKRSSIALGILFCGTDVIKQNLRILTLLERSFLLKAKPFPAHLKIQFLGENPQCVP